jgi:hypothetical protein
VILLDGDNSSATEMRLKLETMDYICYGFQILLSGYREGGGWAIGSLALGGAQQRRRWWLGSGSMGFFFFFFFFFFYLNF